MRIVGCFLECDNKVLLLHRHINKSNGGTWGPPGGKLEPGETDDQAIIRELFEETGYKTEQSSLEPLGVFYCTSPEGITNPWVVYKTVAKQLPHITLSESEHSEYKWVAYPECYDMPNLIYGVKEVLRDLRYVNK